MVKGPNRKNKEQWIKDLSYKYNNKYDYSLIPNDVNSIDKIKIICPQHGVFETQIWAHLNNGVECKKCNIQNNGKKKFVKKSKEIHKGKYEYPGKYNGAKEKIDIWCPLHGVFPQRPTSHLQGAGCPMCKNDKHGDLLRMSNKDFIQKANIIHNYKYNYSNIKYKGYKHKIEIICKKHGSFFQTPMDHLHGSGCPVCASQNWESGEEKGFKKYIENLGFKTKKLKIENNELDIFIPQLNIGFEYNGLYYHSENGGKTKDYHINKTNFFRFNNIRTVHIFSHNWKYKNEIMKGLIKRLLGVCNKKIYARKCTIKKVSVKEAKIFLNENHIQGYSNSTIKLGLYNKDELISIMTFGKCRFSKTHEWELIRYASKNDTIIIGGVNKLFKNFLDGYSPKSILSYCDISIFSGEIYKTLGFNYSHTSSPNYWYFKGEKIIFNRINFQKHKLKDKLEVFDPNLTEWENMKNNGWNRYWDCGNSVWIWENN